jgi:hypothetical protein
MRYIKRSIKSNNNKAQQLTKKLPKKTRLAIDKLDGLKMSGNQLIACCPAHDDTNPSLSISFGKDGRVLLKCHAGCDLSKILDKLGLTEADLFITTNALRTYTYRAADGSILFQVTKSKGKKFRVRRPDPEKKGEWIWNLTGISRVIYRLTKILKAIQQGKPIFIAEGEKDAMTLVNKFKLEATTSPLGAGKWRKEYTAMLDGATKAYVIPDNDDQGKKHALAVAASLHQAGIQVKIIYLPDLPEKGDVTDWVRAGGTKAELEKLYNAINWWEPPQEAKPTPKPKALKSQSGVVGNKSDKVQSSDPLSPAVKMVKVLNNKFAAIMLKGKFHIMEPNYIDPGTGLKQILFCQIPSLERFYSNQLVSTSLDNDKKLVNPITYWMSHKERRTYLGMTFSPNQEIQKDHYNGWQGYNVKPKRGSIKLFLQHVRDIIANGDEEVYRYIMGFLADAVQMPRKRPAVVLVMLGQQGTGKGMFVEYLSRIFGHHFLQLSKASRITGNFNSYLMGVALLFLDEAIWAGDKSAEGTFKTMISEPTLLIEQKYVESFRVQNHLRIIMASNNDWAAPAGLEDRRVFAVEVSDAKLGDTKYFEALAHEMDNGGVEALLDYLLAYDLSQIDIRKFPRTDALRDQKINSMTTVEQFWLSRLEDGQLRSENELDRHWGEVSTKELFDEYTDYFRGQGNQWLGSRQSFGTRLRKLVSPVLKKPINGKKHYIFPSLEDCRKQWIKRTGQSNWGWDDEDVEPEKEDEEIDLDDDPHQTTQTEDDEDLILEDDE